MLDKREDVNKRILSNRKRFECSEFLFDVDSRLKDYSNGDLKVLILFLSNGRYRSGSNTFNILQDICSRNGVFVDFCYFPHPDDLGLYEELEIPYIRGAKSGFLIKDFDVVLISVSVLKECVNLAVIMNHDGIPFGYKKRRDEMYPILALGGSSCHVLSILLGDFKVKGYQDKSLVDIVNYGKGGNNLDELMKVCLKYNSFDDRIDHLSDESWFKPYNLELKYDGLKVIGSNISVKTIYDKGSDVDENFNNKICNMDGSYADRTDILISYGCVGRGYCSFCLEGTLGGCWKQKPIDVCEKDILISRVNQWTESCGVFSYNANYHTQIEHIVGLTREYYDRSSVLMSRADVYSYSDRYINLCKSLGTIKLSIAAEGISDKIRNEFLNKRLSRGELHSAVHQLMGNGILTIKINYILTGREDRVDFEEWVSDISDMVKYKEEKGYKTRLSFTITNLVIYDFTPLRYEKREMAIHSMNYKDSNYIKMFLEYSKKISDMGCGINLYGSGMSNALEQAILDLGFMGTSILVNSVVRDGLRYDRDVTKNMCEKFLKRVDKVIPLSTLFDKRDNDSWFPSNLIDFGERRDVNGVRESYKDLSCEHCINPCKK